MNHYSAVPLEGLYISKTDPTFRITVVEVSIVEDEDDEPDDDLFYLVTWVLEGDEDDMSAMAYELDPTEWQDFVKAEQLEYDRDPYLDSIPENSSLAEIRDLFARTKKNDRS